MRRALKVITFPTAKLLVTITRELNESADRGYDPDTGKPMFSSSLWDHVCNDVRSVPQLPQVILQDWLREKDIMIDMFYEDGMWSGRVFKLNDEEQRWKSGSTHTYAETLEMMLKIGLELL